VSGVEHSHGVKVAEDCESQVPHDWLEGLRSDTRNAVQRLSGLLQELARDVRLCGSVVVRVHPLLVAVRRGAHQLLLMPSSAWGTHQGLLLPFRDAFEHGTAQLVLLGPAPGADLGAALGQGLAALLSERPSADELYVAIHRGFEAMALGATGEAGRQALERYRYELGELLDIACALATEHDPDKLLGLILEKARFVTGADAGSMYVVDGQGKSGSARTLHFKLSQNDSVSFDSREFTMPVSRQSLAGYVAQECATINISDAYSPEADSLFRFDHSFDAKSSYRTKSMLCAPLVSSQGGVIGVVQLINKKLEPSRRLLCAADVDRWVVPFDERSEQLLAALAAQAGIALENALLYQEIRGLFEGFVRASMDAIESRDPTTSGHSRRVAALTLALARSLERADAEPYRGVKWSQEQLRELEYAALLHDFGKIGVREHVLVKAKKLYPHELSRIRQRLDFAIRTAETSVLARKLALVAEGAAPDALIALDRELAQTRADLDAGWQLILASNEPTVLASSDAERIAALGDRSFGTLEGTSEPLLSPDEVKSLCVTRGSLTADEYEQIQSHVSHTIRFLSRIPWGRAVARVPAIAGAHHERLNGTGYPAGLCADDIPLGSKLISVSDIFDSLTASDRPYKNAVPIDKALDILGFEVKAGNIDEHLVRVFVDARVWEGIETYHAPGGSDRPRARRPIREQ
jgi:HD-GYP domain-containing protein (c-di-GMP phosphodiesterase class II)